MTKKHFIALADAIRANKPEHLGEYDDGTTVGSMRARNAQWESTVEALADFCAQQNDRFDRDRWLGYIAGTNGSNGGKVKQGKAHTFGNSDHCEVCGAEEHEGKEFCKV